MTLVASTKLCRASHTAMTDSFPVDPVEAAVGYLAMHDERMSNIEVLLTEYQRNNADLQQQVKEMRALLEHNTAVIKAMPCESACVVVATLDHHQGCGLTQVLTTDHC